MTHVKLPIKNSFAKLSRNQVFSATKKSFSIPLLPSILRNHQLHWYCLTIVYSNSINVLWSLPLIQKLYWSTITRSLIKKFPDDLEAEVGVYSVTYLEFSDKYYGETIKYLNTRISQHASRFKGCNAMYRQMLEKNHSMIGKMHYLSWIIKIKKSFIWSNMLSFQSCLALICI